jgi:hypothetical protein
VCPIGQAKHVILCSGEISEQLSFVEEFFCELLDLPPEDLSSFGRLVSQPFTRISPIWKPQTRETLRRRDTWAWRSSTNETGFIKESGTRQQHLIEEPLMSGEMQPSCAWKAEREREIHLPPRSYACGGRRSEAIAGPTKDQRQSEVIPTAEWMTASVRWIKNKFPD